MTIPTIIVYDMEWTAWEGSRARQWSGPAEHREVVQIGAVRLDADLREIAMLDVAVRPTINPILSDYFIKLTGITQERVDRAGVPFGQALRSLIDFVGPGPTTVFSNGTDSEVLVENCRLNGIDPPPELSSFRNIRPWMRETFQVPDNRVDSYSIPLLIGQALATTEHDALNDARCIAAGLRHAKIKLGVRLPHEG